jgi:hypothetical protein
VLERRSHEWEDNVKMNGTAIRKGGGGLDTFSLKQGQMMVSCEHCNKLSISIKCSEFIKYIYYIIFIY